MLTATKVEQWLYCGSSKIVNNGFTRHNTQRILCRNCGKSSMLVRKKAGIYDFAQLSRAFLERLSLRGVSRVFLISYYQVFQALNLSCLLLPDFKTGAKACHQLSKYSSPRS